MIHAGEAADKNGRDNIGGTNGDAGLARRVNRDGSRGSRKRGCLRSGRARPGGNLPPVEVSPEDRAVRSAPRSGTRVARARPKAVYVPTAPTPTSDSAAMVEADKVPAAVNVVTSREIARTDSLNITNARTARAGHQRQRSRRQSFSAGHSVPRLRGVARGRHAAGPCGLSERGTDQRSLR